MALSYNLAYQESISVHPTRRQIFAGKTDSTFWNIWQWVIFKLKNNICTYVSCPKYGIFVWKTSLRSLQRWNLVVDKETYLLLGKQYMFFKSKAPNLYFYLYQEFYWRVPFNKRNDAPRFHLKMSEDVFDTVSQNFSNSNSKCFT